MPLLSASHSTIFLQKLFGLINLAGQVGATTSIRVISEHQGAMVLPDLVLGKRPFTQLEYQTGFAAGHLGLESAFVERSPKRIEAVGVAPPAEGYEAGSSLLKAWSVEQDSVLIVGDKGEAYEESCSGNAYADGNGGCHCSLSVPRKNRPCESTSEDGVRKYRQVVCAEKLCSQSTGTLFSVRWQPRNLEIQVDAGRSFAGTSSERKNHGRLPCLIRLSRARNFLA